MHCWAVSVDACQLRPSETSVLISRLLLQKSSSSRSIVMAGLEPPCDMPEIIKSADTQDKVIKAKVALENFYTNLLAQHSDRKNRLVLPDLHTYM